MPGTCSVLADRRLGDIGTFRPLSVKPGPHVMPALGELYRFKFVAECDVFLRSRGLSSEAVSESVSLIVLAGEPGVGGVVEREVLELRDERVKAFD